MPKGTPSLKTLRSKALKALEKQLDDYINKGANGPAAMSAVKTVLAKTDADLKQVDGTTTLAIKPKIKFE